jgi:hypothetical protein
MVVHVTYSDICECCLSSSISFDSRAIVQLILSCNDSVRQHSL